MTKCVWTCTFRFPVVLCSLKDGTPIKDDSGVEELEFVAKEKGSYRVEVYLPQLPGPVGQQPWIISNPIYVR